GDQLRGKLHRVTGRVLERMRELGIATPNQSGFPIIEIPLAEADRVDEVGFRLQLTSAHTDEQIEHLCTVLGEVAERFKLRRTPVDDRG
ncbi:MAG TPA: hypothetical protein VME22_25640, partial [Solirubrobacteraceae bacterium]|nr:hypothetical protein [Solirubrobacteraceae bacterium]